MTVSGTCCLAVAVPFGGNPVLVVAVMAVWGAGVIADSAMFSVCLASVVDPRFVGTALTMQTATGFLLTAVTVQGLPLLAGALGWHELTEMAGEGVPLCDIHGYGLLRWPNRSLQALLAAARGHSAEARAITDEVIGWAVPRRAGAMHAYALHARALDAVGRGEFEDAYQNACAVSPAGTIASHVPHAMWLVLDLVEAAVRTGRKDEAAAHVAAAQETDLPAISSQPFGPTGDATRA